MDRISKPEYLLLKRGLYYRPNNVGYTGIRDEAGRYEESDAMPEAGVTAIHERDAPEFSDACWDDIKVRHLTRQRDHLLAALDPNETKAAYIGEVKDDICHYDEDGNEVWGKHTISWTAIKDIMALICKRAGVE
jgi:hypothetical protein